MENNAVKFDSSVPFVVELKLARKTFEVSFPTDEQWFERSKKVKTLFVPRAGGSATEVDGIDAANLALVREIKQGEAVADDAEASRIIAKISYAARHALTPDGDNLRIALYVAGMADGRLQKIETEHVLRIPSEKEFRQHGKTSEVITKRDGVEELRTNPRAMVSFYDKLALADQLRGYASPVPVPHKLACVAELVQFIARLEDDEDPF